MTRTEAVNSLAAAIIPQPGGRDAANPTEGLGALVSVATRAHLDPVKKMARATPGSPRLVALAAKNGRWE